MKILRKHRSLLLIPVTLAFFAIFFFIMGNRAAADAGGLDEMKGYESVLIKDGDTLNSIASSYAKEYSHFTESEYREAIVSLNSLPSECIKSGVYILLPKYR